jgi:Lon protease-like protein
MAGLHRVGCSALLRDVRKLPDGRFDIITRGNRRFRLLEVDATVKPYLVGTVTWLPDESEEPLPAQRLRTLAVAARRAHQRYCRTAWRTEEWREPAEDVSDDTLPHLLAADCLLPMRDRQLLLEQTCPTRRLRMVRVLLSREAALLARLRAVPAPLASYAVEHSDN